MGNRELAEKLHDERCHLFHEDQCGWYYEVESDNPWDGWAHKRWLEEAERFREEWTGML